VKPNDDVVVRIARSEMGQGTITGLAQMVAEELECDWKKVSYEYPSPSDNLKRKLAWGSFSTGGSRGIRTSEQYVRKGGAAARMMLIQAAATQWNVPVSECIAKDSVITHTPTGRKVTFGNVSVAASQLEVPKDIVLKDHNFKASLPFYVSFFLIIVKTVYYRLGILPKHVVYYCSILIIFKYFPFHFT
jgi:isoquinoline 1-oxidoreductase beta subunit